MGKSKGRKATGAGESRGKSRVVLSLQTAEKMLPLVGQILEGIRGCWDQLSDLETEQNDLERRRRSLGWPERARRYQVADDITAEQRRLQEAVLELEQLEVVLVDPIKGEAAFPTMINGRRGYFVWKLGEPTIKSWCYAHEGNRHAIPAGWRAQAEA